MSNAFAIAAVTAALKAALRNAVAITAVSDALGGAATVSALPPDRVNPTGTPEPNQLNLFLYSVSANQGWRNQHQPVRDSNGMRIDNQPLALDLHYLLTAYGASDYGAEILLGHGMHALHEVPFFTRSWLADTLKSSSPPNDIPPALETTGLPEQVEQIRITPTVVSLDDMSRIWSAMQARYRPTATYAVTVVLIDGRRSRRSAMPVLERKILVEPWSGIHIDDAVNAAGETLMLTAGAVLRLRGTGLGNSDARVKVMGIDLSASVARRTDTQLDVALPDPLPGGIRAGVIPVMLVQPTVGDIEFSSNAVGILLRPSITGVAFAANKVTVTLSPSVTPSQRVVLLLNQRQPGAGQVGKAFSIAAPPRNGIVAPARETNTIPFLASSVPAGTYVVRVQVDGAESPVELDASGRIDKPKVTIA